MSKLYTINSDGGARGNPGPAGIGVVIKGGGIGVKEYAESIGETTNNVAEYKAVIFGLKKLKSLIGSKEAGESEVEILADSELLVKQLNSEYKIKELELQKLFVELWNLRLDFRKITFSHIPREQNKRADELLNRKLDEGESRLDL